MNEGSEIVIRDKLLISILFIWIIGPTMIKRWINGRFKKMTNKIYELAVLQLTDYKMINPGICFSEENFRLTTEEA